MTEFLTPDQFRCQYNPPLPRNKTFEMLRTGEIRSIRDGRFYRIPHSEVSGLLQRRLESLEAAS